MLGFVTDQIGSNHWTHTPSRPLPREGTSRRGAGDLIAAWCKMAFKVEVLLISFNKKTKQQLQQRDPQCPRAQVREETLRLVGCAAD